MKQIYTIITIPKQQQQVYTLLEISRDGQLSLLPFMTLDKTKMIMTHLRFTRIVIHTAVCMPRMQHMFEQALNLVLSI